MYNFKVGDRVIRTGPTNTGGLMIHGATYTVVNVSPDDFIMVREVEGKFDIARFKLAVKATRFRNLPAWF